jgi:hypothetical protein
MRRLTWTCLSLLTLTLSTAAAQETTELGKLAAAMKPGTWAELKTQGYDADLLKVQSHHILEYTDTAVWDPRSQQVLFVGQGHYSALKFITYSAKSNTWKLMPTPSWWKGDPQTGKGPIGHAYNNNAIDAARGILYHHQSATPAVHQYDIAKETWSSLPELKDARTGHGTAIVYFPEMKGLVRVYSGTGQIQSGAESGDPGRGQQQQDAASTRCEGGDHAVAGSSYSYSHQQHGRDGRPSQW